jgi:hypothetical protein
MPPPWRADQRSSHKFVAPWRFGHSRSKKNLAVLLAVLNPRQYAGQE